MNWKKMIMFDSVFGRNMKCQFCGTTSHVDPCNKCYLQKKNEIMNCKNFVSEMVKNIYDLQRYGK